MQTHCTSIAREAGWRQEQNAVNFADTARSEAERLAGIALHFNFQRDENGCFFDAAGQPVQLAMSLTEKFTGSVRTVVVKAVDGEWTWIVENLGNCPYAAWELIECVRVRVGARLAGQLSGRVN